MIYIGLDDTDTRETPGTNKLAMHLAGLLDDRYITHWIVRHQLLEDPRVPCTNRNGCVSLQLEPLGDTSLPALIDYLRDVIIRWCPEGSDPGLCVIDSNPERLIPWGRRVQTELVEQSAAIDLARTLGIHLEPLGGTGGGVIGALAAVGLLATWNSGRVIHAHRAPPNAFALTGTHAAEKIYASGVDDILSIVDGRRVETGEVDLVKRLRPNMRDGRVTLYVARAENGWQAQRIVA